MKKKTHKKQQSNRQRGFTLIELMVVVAIIGILSTLAYSSYETQIRKTRRATANQSILECAAILERRFTLNSTYTANACNNLANDHFNLTVVVAGLNRGGGRNCTSANGNQNCYEITARPRANNSDSECAQIIMNELGVKSALNAANTDKTTTCWRSAN